MDAVIMYVNGMDPLWRTECVRYASINDISPSKFMDWGTLKYVLRGIEKCMPYINNIFLVVSSESQVPEYVNRDRVKIVLHEDFIPSEYLPLFNSSSIEMFLWNIEGLDEDFVYFNDDMIPMNPIPSELIFNEDKPCYTFIKDSIVKSYYLLTIKEDNFLSSVLFNRTSEEYLRPLHSISPFKKSFCKYCYNEMENTIAHKITKFRRVNNVSQYFYTNAFYYSENYCNNSPSLKYITSANGEDVISTIPNIEEHILCFNDYESIPSKSLKESIDYINSLLTIKYPSISSYEN